MSTADNDTNHRTAFPMVFVPGVGHLDYICGVSESTYQIARHLAATPLFITNGPYGLTRRLIDDGCPVEVAPFDTTAFRGFRQANFFKKLRIIFAGCRWCFRLFRSLRRHKVRIVYTVSQAAIMSALPVKLARARLVVGIRGDAGSMHKWRWLLRVSDRIVVLSEEMKESLLKAIGAKAASRISPKLRVIHNGVTIHDSKNQSEERNAMRGRLSLCPDDILVLYPAAFCPRKNQLQFIEEVIPKCFDHPTVGRRLAFAIAGSAIGEPEYEKACRMAAAESVHSDRIHFLGNQKYIWPWYSASDIIALASMSEGMPRVLIEAMACGKAAVSYAVCSARELLESNEAGIVTPLGDSEGMQQTIVSLAADVDRRAMLGANGLVFARAKLEITEIAHEYQNMFDELT